MVASQSMFMLLADKQETPPQIKCHLICGNVMPTNILLAKGGHMGNPKVH